MLYSRWSRVIMFTKQRYIVHVLSVSLNCMCIIYHPCLIRVHVRTKSVRATTVRTKAVCTKAVRTKAENNTFELPRI